jgi:hypothetical protein
MPIGNVEQNQTFAVPPGKTTVTGVKISDEIDWRQSNKS